MQRKERLLMSVEKKMDSDQFDFLFWGRWVFYHYYRGVYCISVLYIRVDLIKRRCVLLTGENLFSLLRTEIQYGNILTLNHFHNEHRKQVVFFYYLYTQNKNTFYKLKTLNRFFLFRCHLNIKLNKHFLKC